MINSPFTPAMSVGLADELASLAARVEKAHAVIGLDGFVDTILHAVDARTGPNDPELKGLAANARLIAWVNWTCISEILEQFLALAVAGLTGPKRVAFFDLADPARRSQAALQGVLQLI